MIDTSGISKNMYTDLYVCRDFGRCLNVVVFVRGAFHCCICIIGLPRVCCMIGASFVVIPLYLSSIIAWLKLLCSWLGIVLYRVSGGNTLRVYRIHMLLIWVFVSILFTYLLFINNDVAADSML